MSAFNRGSVRMTGRGDWKGKPSQSSWQQRKQATPRTDPLGPIIDSINVKELLIDTPNIEIKDVQYVASYNWVQRKQPTILVPGSPPAWTPPATDLQLKPDQREAFRDLNAARWPNHPLEPAVRSITAMRPTFDLSSVNIVACSHTLIKLLDLARSAAEPFRFDVDVIGETVFFTRKGASPTEIIADLRGYGFRFPEIYTTWDADVRDSESHQRTIHFMFGGLNVLLRSGTDAYIQTPGLKSNSAMTSPPVRSLEEELDELFPRKQTEVVHKDLLIEHRGSKIPQHQIFEIKTRGVLNPIDMDAHLPRLWLCQIPNMLVAYHTRGRFDNPKVDDMQLELQDWEVKNRDVVAQFHALVKWVIATVLDGDKQQCEISWSGQGDLMITEQMGVGRRALPVDLHHLFTDQNDE